MSHVSAFFGWSGIIVVVSWYVLSFIFHLFLGGRRFFSGAGGFLQCLGFRRKPQGTPLPLKKKKKKKKNKHALRLFWGCPFSGSCLEGNQRKSNPC